MRRIGRFATIAFTPYRLEEVMARESRKKGAARPNIGGEHETSVRA
jgi:hypothetical protein